MPSTQAAPPIAAIPSGQASTAKAINTECMSASSSSHHAVGRHRAPSRCPRFRTRFVAGRRRFNAALTHALEERTATLGAEPSVPPEHLALLLTALVNGLSVDVLTEPGSVLSDGLLEEAVSALLQTR